MLRTLRQHITIRRDLSVSGPTFSERINLQFIPHEVIVREVMYSPVDQDQIFGSMITSNLLTNDDARSTLGFFSAYRDDQHHSFYNSISNSSSVHTLSNFSNNNDYQFNVLTSSGALFNSNGTILIHLEFVRHT